MQEANQTDDASIRIRERDRVVWTRTQAFAALLLLIIFWTISIWIYRASVEKPESQLPADLVVDEAVDIRRKWDIRLSVEVPARALHVAADFINEGVGISRVCRGVRQGANGILTGGRENRVHSVEP